MKNSGNSAYCGVSFSRSRQKGSQKGLQVYLKRTPAWLFYCGASQHFWNSYFLKKFPCIQDFTEYKNVSEYKEVHEHKNFTEYKKVSEYKNFTEYKNFSYIKKSLKVKIWLNLKISLNIKKYLNIKISLNLNIEFCTIWATIFNESNILNVQKISSWRDKFKHRRSNTFAGYISQNLVATVLYITTFFMYSQSFTNCFKNNLGNCEIFDFNVKFNSNSWFCPFF